MLYLDIRIKRIIKELDVKIEYRYDIDKPGYYIPVLNIIILYSGLSELEEACVLLHELGHAAEHQKNYILYNQTAALHSKMETQADRYMVKKVLDFYLEDPMLQPETFNVVRFLENNDLGLEHESFVKNLLRGYSYEENFA